MNMKTVLIIGVVILIGLVGRESMFVVNEAEQALVIRLGRPVAAFNANGQEAGLHFKRPFTDSVDIYSRKILDLDMERSPLTAADRERIEIDAFMRYRINDPQKFRERLRNLARGEATLTAIMSNVLRDVVATVPSQDVISGQRAEIMRRVQVGVENEVSAQDLGVEVIDIRIKRAELPSNIRNRVFERMIAERGQEAQRIRSEGEERAREIRANANRQVRVIQAEAEAEAKRIRGDADAQATAIYAEAFGRDPEFYRFYRSLQAYETAVRAGTPIIVPADSEFFRYFQNLDGGDGN